MKSFSSIFKRFSTTDSTAPGPLNVSAKVEAEAAKNRGNAFVAAGNDVSAVQCYQEALKILPAYAEAMVNLGAALQRLGRFQEAQKTLQSAIALKPSLWQGHFQLGLVQNELGEFQQAVESYHKSIGLSPDNPDCYWHLGRSLMAMENWAGAIEAFGSANIANRDFPLVLKGKCYEQLWMLREAELCYRSAVEFNPDNSRAHLDLSFLLLLKGDYLNGFTHYEKRLNLDAQAEWPRPLKHMIANLGVDRYWKGQQIAAANIMVITEQGLGDALMMLRYVPLLKTLKAAARVCVVCDEPLARIFRSIPEVDEVRSPIGPFTECNCDWYCSAMSLPHLFRTELSSIPSPLRPAVSELDRSKWAKRLGTLDGLKVGIAWSGNPRLVTDAIRSIALEKIIPLFSIPGIVWINLQKGKAVGQLQIGTKKVHDWMDDTKDLMDTAALVDCLDLVITVDTSIAHLAGTMGRPTWLLNRYETEWRWLLEREDSPWYPGVRILRQSRRNDWDSVIDKVDKDLRHKLQN